MINKLLIGLALFTGLAFAQQRPVVLSWTASPTAGITGYAIARGTSTSGPFTILTITSGTTTSYTDSTAVVGSTYTYQVSTVTPACTPTTPVTTACGTSLPASATTNVPPNPTATITVTITVP